MDYNSKTLPWGTSTEQWNLAILLLTQPQKMIDVCNYNHSEHPLGLCITARVLDSKNPTHVTLSSRQTQKHGREGLKDVKRNDCSCAIEVMKR